MNGRWDLLRPPGKQPSQLHRSRDFIGIDDVNAAKARLREYSADDCLCCRNWRGLKMGTLSISGSGVAAMRGPN